MTACSTSGQEGSTNPSNSAKESTSSSEQGSTGEKEKQADNSISADSFEEYRIEESSGEVVSILEDFPQLEKAGFAHYTSVFGIPVIGTEDVTEETMLHVRGVLAGYLDNDQDGIADNPKVVSALLNSFLAA